MSEQCGWVWPIRPIVYSLAEACNEYCVYARPRGAQRFLTHKRDNGRQNGARVMMNVHTGHALVVCFAGHDDVTQVPDPYSVGAKIL